MDQVKAILKQIGKYHFWLLCLICMITGLLGWFMARKSLSAAYDQKKGTIVQKFVSMQDILAIERHPHDDWTKAVGTLTDQEKKIVAETWQSIYDEQKKQLVWPADLDPRFLKFVNERPPAETIPQELCSLYGNQIRGEFPKLLAIIDAAPYDSTKGKSEIEDVTKKKDPKAPPEEPEHEFAVSWDSANQQRVHAGLDFPTVPSSFEVRLAQEDLWVYAALLQIVHRVNAGHIVPMIRQIFDISIGKAAATASQVGMGHDHVMRLREKSEEGQTGGGQQRSSNPGDPDAPPKALDEGRYVSAEGEPQAGGTAATQQFKRMPIFMRLQIDEREIPKLLVECANSPLPVEVRQLRINPLKNAAGSSTPKAGAGRPAANPGEPAEGESYEVPIELHGVIYIYNPPDMTKLGKPGEAGAAAPPSG